MQSTFQIQYEWDIVKMRSEVRVMAKKMGFDELDQARIVQSVSELARNIIQHAEEGWINVEKIECKDKSGIAIQVKDSGPGIPDFHKLLMRVKRERMGEPSGLQQVLMLMDEFTIDKLDSGVRVEVIKWMKKNEFPH